MFVLLFLLCGCHENEPFNNISEENNEKIDFLFDEEKNINMKEAIDSFDYPEFTRNVEIKNNLKLNYFPEEIVDVLVSENVEGEDSQLYIKYLSDNYISINTLIDNNPEFGNMTNLIGDRVVYDIKKTDIDYDGVYEYLIEYSEGAGAKKAFSIFKNIDDKMTEVFYFFEEYGHYELLEFDNEFYILAGNYVLHYNKMIGEWEKITIKRVVMDYEKYEFFSNSQFAEEYFFNNIDLVNRTNWIKGADVSFSFICGSPDILINKMDDNVYFYVYVDFKNHTFDDRDDRLLFIIKEQQNGDFEIVKAYYLAAKLQLIIQTSADFSS